MSKVTAGRLDERSRLSEWGPYSDWEEGLTHPEGGVQRTPSSALGLLWTCGAINALKTEEHPASGLEACLPMSGMLGMGVHSTALSTVSQRTPPPRPMHQVVGENPDTRVNTVPARPRGPPHPFLSFAMLRNPKCGAPPPSSPGASLGADSPLLPGPSPRPPACPWMIKAVRALPPPCPRSCPHPCLSGEG